ncbi:urate hydroxylase PuuD [Marinibactrum halimedae]|uniref:Membrane protein n=1 Tax=Marinibactrum halimedae TaxID=1444977 RepID=A0AA37WM15_9GAMM|nr:urate hydroxylase PuuD [Marinibactrum halimedae]MCD9459674.1 urate hydroxylase PuuD [Marinibactrum halimedae]GLS25700.1 membrane protein [Marinibactrum halimedae]
MLTSYILDWLSLGFRWLHVLAAIAWIGSSFKYVWVDNNLRKPPKWKEDKGIKGDVWVIHGGGIYEFQKYNVAPERMPDVLHWVKWESYTTWLTGFMLVSVIYYGQAATYMLAAEGLITSPMISVLAGLGFLLGTLGIYECLIRTPLVRKGPVFAVTMGSVLLGLSYLAFELFAPRAAALHVGAAIGTLMTGNVFFGIVPSQKAFVKAIEEGREPDVNRAAFAKLRSTHNNYFTLPVIMLMISNHYPIIYSHAHGWLLIVAIGAISAYARHFFNLRNQGVLKPHILAIAAVAMVAVAYAIRPIPVALTQADTEVETQTHSLPPVTDLEGLSLIQTHCSNCHSTTPTQPGFVAPPAGIVFESADQIKALAPKVRSVAVDSQYMPLGNFTNMTTEERLRLGRWLDGLSQ